MSDETALWAELRTVLARLELISSATIGSYNPGGGTGDGGDGTPPGDRRTAADHFRARLADVEHVEQRKLDQALDDHARQLAHQKAHLARREILRDATSWSSTARTSRSRLATPTAATSSASSTATATATSRSIASPRRTSVPARCGRSAL